ncbi:MAG: M28 family metallopeptidase [Vicinamibacterales bacterium]
MLLACGMAAGCAGDAARSFAPVPLSDLPPIDIDAVVAHTRELASDRYEGRAPGGAGEDLTVAYLEGQFRGMGLAPGAPDGTFIQRVPLVGITATPAPLVVGGAGEPVSFAWRTDVVAATRRVAESVAVADSEIIFVGYGTVAPEFGWDDYKGVDVAGKTLVMLVNDPPVRSMSSSSGLDPRMFGGNAMTYYGRWTYKYEIGAAKGAAGVLLIHETEAAGYPFDVVQNSWTGEQFDLAGTDQHAGRVAIEGWLSLDAGRRMLTLAGQDLDALRRAAASPDFKPVPLGLRANMTLENKLRTIDSRNVIARLDGSDPSLKDEAVVYMAHWDHLGVGEPFEGDAIYNGARDNAVGTAGMLEIARSFLRLEPAPRRSILFAAVTAEEQGLLGSRHYTTEPSVPMAKTAAVINIDTLNVHGRTSDLTLIGHGASDLDRYVQDALREQGRTAIPDPNPEAGSFYRSDHFSFARQGVPALFPDKGLTYVGRPEDFGVRMRQEYVKNFYHRPDDELTADWDMSGAAEDLLVFLAVGYRVAQTTALPEWAPDNEFSAIREASLAADRRPR